MTLLLLQMAWLSERIFLIIFGSFKHLRKNICLTQTAPFENINGSPSKPAFANFVKSYLDGMIYENKVDNDQMT
jgi:hypothetical protein